MWATRRGFFPIRLRSGSENDRGENDKGMSSGKMEHALSYCFRSEFDPSQLLLRV